MNKERIIVIIGIIISVVIIGLSVYMIIDAADKVNQDCNGTVLNKNTKVKEDLNKTTTNTVTNGETTKIRPSEELCENENLDCLLERFKKLLVDTNNYEKNYESPEREYSEINYLDIIKIDAIYINDEFYKYELYIKYSCSDNSPKCIVVYDDKDKDEQGHYSYYKELAIRNNKYRIGDFAISGGSNNKVERKTIYEK